MAVASWRLTTRTRMRQIDFGAYGDVGVAKKRYI